MSASTAAMPSAARTPPTGWLGPLVRPLVAAGALLLCIGAPAKWLLETLLPVNRAVFALLVPDFRIHDFSLRQRGPHLKVVSAASNRRYVVVRGRTVRPGLVFDVETPARIGLLGAALVVAGTSYAVRGGRRTALAVGVVALPAAALLLVGTVPLILAGQHWGLTVDAWQEPTIEAALVAVSELLLHGGVYALSAAAVCLAWATGRATLGWRQPPTLARA